MLDLLAQTTQPSGWNNPELLLSAAGAFLVLSASALVVVLRWVMPELRKWLTASRDDAPRPIICPVGGESLQHTLATLEQRGIHVKTYMHDVPPSILERLAAHEQTMQTMRTEQAENLQAVEERIEKRDTQLHTMLNGMSETQQKIWHELAEQSKRLERLIGRQEEADKHIRPK